MTRRLAPLTLDNVDDLPSPCRGCAFWEQGRRQPDAMAKEDWIATVLLESGRCGKVVYVDGTVAGFALYAPSRFVAGGPGLAGAAPSSDAMLLMTARVLPEYADGGLGRVLVQAVVKDVLRRRGVRALEAYGDLQGRELGCVLPVSFLTAVGFKTVRPHLRFPLLRLELHNVLAWRDEIELALERWIGQLRPEGAPTGAISRSSPPGG